MRSFRFRDDRNRRSVLGEFMPPASPKSLVPPSRSRFCFESKLFSRSHLEFVEVKLNACTHATPPLILAVNFDFGCFVFVCRSSSTNTSGIHGWLEAQITSSSRLYLIQGRDRFRKDRFRWAIPPPLPRTLLLDRLSILDRGFLSVIILPVFSALEEEGSHPTRGKRTPNKSTQMWVNSVSQPKAAYALRF